MKITVAGASGFVGRNLIDKLIEVYDVNGLSRTKKEPSPNLNWVQTDLFSYTCTQKALEGTDIAIYLVHSMLPSSRLFQGSFQDTDLLLADNFAKACKRNGVKQVIYLGGLVPESGESKHLVSRKEVEDVFKASDVPVTILRAGLVVGAGGSSFEILNNLVHNLPGMILPLWTQRNTQAIYVDDLISVIFHSINNEGFLGKTINVVNGQAITYAQLIKETATYVGSNMLMIAVPINYTSFSKLWVKIFGQADYELVSPLIDSLLCDLPTPKISKEIESIIKYREYKAMLINIPKKKKVKRKSKPNIEINNVRSIQRLSNFSQLNHEQLSEKFISWLPKYLRFLITAKWDRNLLKFNAIGLKYPLLILEKDDSINYLDRSKFQIVGGLLSKSEASGWLEFRIVSNKKHALASINEFIPSLPWYIYKITQAPLHAFIMHKFSESLQQTKPEIMGSISE